MSDLAIPEVPVFEDDEAAFAYWSAQADEQGDAPVIPDEAADAASEEASQPATTEEQEQQPDPEAQQEETQPDQLDPVQRLAQLEHQYQSERERAKGLNQKYNTLRQLVQPADNAAEVPHLSADELEDMAAMFPAAAKAIAQMQMQLQRVSAATQTVSEIHAAQAEAAEAADLSSAVGMLEQVLPGWQSDVREPQFAAFVQQLPPFAQAAAESNNPQDVAWLVNQYRQAKGTAVPQSQAMPAPVNRASSFVSGMSQQQTAQAVRKQRLAAAAAPTVTGQPARDNPEHTESLDAAFAHHWGRG